MKLWLLALLVVPLAIIATVEELALLTGGMQSPRATTAATTFYVQLIRGNDHDEPPEPGMRLAGPKLEQTMRTAFRLKNFWEINRREVRVSAGQRARVALANGREVVIDLSEPGKRTVAAFCNGELMDRAVRPVGPAMTIMGGNETPDNVWFVVVRRDVPPAR